jgi:hypothetical protein
MLDSAGRLIGGPDRDRTDDLFDAFSITCETPVAPLRPCKHKQHQGLTYRKAYRDRGTRAC